MLNKPNKDIGKTRWTSQAKKKGNAQQGKQRLNENWGKQKPRPQEQTSQEKSQYPIKQKNAKVKQRLKDDQGKQKPRPQQQTKPRKCQCLKRQTKVKEKLRQTKVKATWASQVEKMSLSSKKVEKLLNNIFIKLLTFPEVKKEEKLSYVNKEEVFP